MNDDLNKLKEIFVSNVDPELAAENLEKIREWEQGILSAQALASWKEHDITQQIAKQAKETYRDIGIQLATHRRLTEAQRLSLWASQDAMAWLLSLVERDPKAELERINRQIKNAIEAV